MIITLIFFLHILIMKKLIVVIIHIATMNTIKRDLISFMYQYEGGDLVHKVYSYMLQQPIEAVDIRIVTALVTTGKKILIEHNCVGEVRNIILNFLQLYGNHQLARL
jgi:hypothetical protein